MRWSSASNGTSGAIRFGRVSTTANGTPHAAAGTRPAAIASFKTRAAAVMPERNRALQWWPARPGQIADTNGNEQEVVKVTRPSARRAHRRFSLGVPREGRSPLFDDLPGGEGYTGKPEGLRLRFPAKFLRPSASRGSWSRRSAPLIVTDSDAGIGEQPFDGPVDDARERASLPGGAILKCAFTIARWAVGAARPGSRSRRAPGRDREDDRILGIEAEAGKAPKSRLRPSPSSKRFFAACGRNGSERLCLGETAARVPRRRPRGPRAATSGRQARPPAPSVSRRSWAARPAAASSGSVLSAARSMGRHSRS